MGKIDRHFALGAAVLILGGCGLYPDGGAGAEDDAQREEILPYVEPEAIDVPASADTPTPVAAPSPVPPRMTAPAPQPSIVGSPSLDSFALDAIAIGSSDYGLFGPAEAPDLLSLFFDSLVIDPVGPSPLRPSTDPTCLELLCRDTDIPDFRCRQRYGN